MDPRFTERLAFDFTDVSTSPVGRQWAAIDPRVLYLEDPDTPRCARRQPSPPHPAVAGLREAFRRDRVAWLADRLNTAHDLVRRWRTELGRDR